MKKQAGVAENDVKIVWMGERSVTVKDIRAFSQPSGDGLGGFVGAFSHLKIDM